MHTHAHARARTHTDMLYSKVSDCQVHCKLSVAFCPVCACLHTCVHVCTDRSAAVSIQCCSVCVMFMGVFICVCVSTVSACYPMNAARTHPVWVEGQTLGLANLLTHEPSVVLNGAQPVSSVDVVDLNGLAPSCTTEDRAPAHIIATHHTTSHHITPHHTTSHHITPLPNHTHLHQVCCNQQSGLIYSL